MTPPDPITGNAYEIDGLPQLAVDMANAIDALASDRMLARIFPAQLIDNLCQTKRQEMARFSTIPTERHWQTYLDAV